MSNSTDGRIFSILGIVFGAFAIFLFVFITGPIAIILSIIAKRKGEKLANLSLAVSLICTVIGFVLLGVVGVSEGIF
ncbi:MAG: hypothetical protein ACO3BG_04085 [Candidatus Nanopelagicales bacterium]|jgi:hypothetical protein